MRRAFASWLLEKAKEDESVYLVVGDIGYKVFDEFREEFPDRFINMGLCEQTMMSAVAGMALEGLKPYVYSITPFITERVMEQIKIDVNMNNVNVKIVGYDDYPTQGITHVVTGDGKFMEIFENIKCYWPNDSEETKNFLDESYELECPTFIRLQKDKKI